MVRARTGYLKDVIDVVYNNELKGHCIVINNSLVNKPLTVRNYIEKRGYKSVYYLLVLFENSDAGYQNEAEVKTFIKMDLKGNPILIFYFYAFYLNEWTKANSDM